MIATSTEIWTNIIPMWLEAIGTILAVLVALFYKPFIDFIRRPKIFISCPDNKICIQKMDIACESSSKEKRIKIRVKIENKGKGPALHSEVIVDTVYKKQMSNTDYVKIDYVPFNLKDNQGGVPKALAPNLVYYFDLAVISRPDEMSNDSDKLKQKQFYKLSVITDKSPQQLGRGTFIIPIKVCSSRLSRPTISYLKIYWDGDEYTDSKDVFSVEVMSKNEFDRIKIVK